MTFSGHAIAFKDPGICTHLHRGYVLTWRPYTIVHLSDVHTLPPANAVCMRSAKEQPSQKHEVSPAVLPEIILS